LELEQQIGLALVVAYKFIFKDSSVSIGLGVAIGVTVGALIDWLQSRK